MEDNNSTEIEYLKFLKDDEAPEIFGKIDYLLKDGVHIQEYGDQIPYYRFLKNHSKSMNQYFERFFGISLIEENKESDSYFFLDFTSTSRSKIPSSFRDTLKNDYIIIGLIMYKVIFLERNFELSSVKSLKETIRNDYEEYKVGLIKLIAQSTGDYKMHDDDLVIDNTIDRALKQFKKLGWLELRNDKFEPRASFQRIMVIYGDVINRIDEIIAEYQ